MPSSSSDRNPVEILAEQFMERQRRGEHPSLTEYTRRYPDLADEIRELFPALVVMEQLKPAVGDHTGPYLSDAARHPERLGDYRILREVGRGGMGVVYEAEQVSLGRHVALKVLPAAALLDAQRLQRFGREARAAARLHHTNIVPVFGVGEADGLHYYVMQFIPGLGLHEVLEELRQQRHAKVAPVAPPVHAAPAVSAAAVAQSLMTGKFTIPLRPTDDESGIFRPDGAAAGTTPSSPTVPAGTQSGTSTLREEGGAYWQGVARIGMQAATALSYAHGQGVLHRDVKPSNLLLDTAGNVWITDFGLAKVLADADNLTHTGDIVGTLRYMAPERFTGHGDARSDVYSLGLTLYELLTLRPAFAAPDRTQLIHKVLHEEPERPRALNPRVPRDLETVVLKAMAREPDRRYATAQALADDLKHYLAGEPITARRVGPAERVVRWAQRRPTQAGLLATLGLLLVLAPLAAGMALAWREAEKARLDTTDALGRAEDAKQQTDLALAGEKQAKQQAELALAGEKQAKQQTEAANDKLDQVLYLHRVSLAHAAWRDHDISLATQLLGECPPGRRHWEWHYVNRLCHPELLTLEGHTGQVRSACFSPDGKRVASGSWDGTARVWDLSTGKEVLAFKGRRSIFCVCFSPDGKRLAAGGSQGGTPFPPALGASTVGFMAAPLGQGPLLTASALFPGRLFPPAKNLWVWDLATKKEVFSAHCNTAARRVSFSPDGRRLVTCDNDRVLSVKVWDLATGKTILTPGGQLLAADVCFSPDGRWGATGDWGGTLKIWDAETGQESFTLRAAENVRVGPEAFTFPGGTTSIDSVCFSPDGRRLAASYGVRYGVGGSGMVRVWDLDSRREALTLRGHSKEIDCICFSPDGRRLVSGGKDGSVKVWDLASGEDVLTFQDHQAEVTSVSVSPDGRRLASSSDDRTVKVRDLTENPEAFSLGGVRAARCVCFSPDGRRLAASGGDSLTAGAIEPSLDGETLFRGNAVHVWDLATGRELITLRGHVKTVNSICFSPDGRRLASGGLDRTVKVWDLAQRREILSFEAHRDGVMSVCFSPDGKLLATGGKDPPPIWKLPAIIEEVNIVGLLGSPLGQGPFTASALVSRNGRSTFPEGSLKVWDAQTGQELLRLEGHGGSQQAVESVCFSPDGQWLASGGSQDRTARVWDLATGKEIRRFKGSWSNTRSVTFSPDGRRLAAANNDSSLRGNFAEVRVWDVSDGREIFALRVLGTDVNCLCFSPDGRRLASSSRDRSLRLWDVETGQEVLVLKGHQAEASGVCFSPDGRRLVSADYSANAVKVWAAEELTPEVREARLVRQEKRASGWHLREAEAAAQDQSPSAIAFHLKYLADVQDESPSFYADRGRLYLRLGRNDQALADFTRAIEQIPLDYTAWCDRAEAYTKLGKWDQAVADLARAIKLAPREGRAWYLRAAAHANLGQWRLAEADLARTIGLTTRDCAERWMVAKPDYFPGGGIVAAWNHLALVRLAAGDTAGYRATCAAMLENFFPPRGGGLWGEPRISYAIAWSCVLAPDAVSDHALLVRLARRAVELEPRSPAFVYTLGSVLYRTGKLDEAVQRLNEAVALHDTGGSLFAWLFLAMAQHRLGRHDEAKQSFAKALTLSDEKATAGLPWDQRLELRLLRREAETLLKPMGP
jgi:WD40 repeat protein/serine/threonine protein kinase/tetratricopeptide (TPR) repeat protein